MKIESLARNLRILWRADTIIADIHIRHLAARSGLVAAAGAIAIFSLLMFDLSIYFALEDLWGRVWAAVTLGALNLAIALGLVVFAARSKPGRELEFASEVHASALEALMADARSIEAEVHGITHALKRPFDSTLASLIVPLASLLVKALGKSHQPPASV